MFKRIAQARVVIVGVLVWMASSAGAEFIEEIVVTASMAQGSVPAARIVRRADNLLLEIEIINDSREESQREREIQQTLEKALARARRAGGIELSVVSDGGFVVPLASAANAVELSPGARADTSRTTIYAKAPLASVSDDGSALVRKLKSFVKNLEMVGRTEAIAESDAEVSVINPGQYRAQVIAAMAEDAKAVTSALGEEDYRIILSGIDRPVQWGRVGLLDVAIYIDYGYTVVPTSIESYTAIEDY